MGSQRKHDPARLGTYFSVHYRVMDQLLREGFVLTEELSLFAHDGHFIMEGTIYCLGGIRIEVNKRIRLTYQAGEKFVQTVHYRYHVQLDGHGPVLRYDRGHRDHRMDHHVHRYDVLNADKHGAVDFIYNEDDVPTLREVIAETRDWYYESLDRLAALDR